MDRKIKVGIVGLGRMGMDYAINLQHKIRGAQLIAACSVSEDELKYAVDVLMVSHTFTDYDEMLRLEEIEAIFVISPTDMHVTHMIKALEAGKHVYSEKPLGIDLEECYRAQETANKYPNLTATVGFVRRFDQSYLYAKEKIKAGTIGKPFLVRSQTVDMDMVADFQIKYVKRSGGIFHDYNVHDIDLARWFLESEVAQVNTIGGAYKYPAFAEMGDADNVLTSCVFENGAMAIIGASRTAMHGHDTYTEIVGTEGTLRIGRPANKNRVEIYDAQGARQEWIETYWERFEDAFLSITEDFIDCIANDRRPELTLNDAIRATEAAIAFTTSFAEQKTVTITQFDK